MDNKNTLQFILKTQSEITVSLNEFLISMRQQNRSPRTVELYRWNLDRLVIWLAERGIDSAKSVSRTHLREWGASLYEYWQPPTIKVAIAAARSFFRWCHDEEIIDTNPAKTLKTPRVPETTQRTVTPDEVTRMIERCNIGTVIGLRDRAIISLLFDSGLRAAELCSLKLDDLDLEAMNFVVRVKGGQKKPGWFGERTQEYLTAWLRVRQTLPTIRHLFLSIGGTTPGQPIKEPGSICKRLKNTGRQAGIKNITTHSFRRGFAVMLSKGGAPDNVIKDFGRWNSTDQIRRYTRAQQVADIYPMYSPMDNLPNDDSVPGV